MNSDLDAEIQLYDKVKKTFGLNDAKQKKNSDLSLSLQFFKKSNGYSRSIDDWETRGNYKYTTQVA